MQRKHLNHISPSVGAALLALSLPTLMVRPLPAQATEAGNRDALYQGGLTNLRAQVGSACPPPDAPGDPAPGGLRE